VDLRVETVPAKLTYALRQRVLRPHQRVDEVATPGEAGPDVTHIAALTPDGEVVGTAVLIREPFRLMPNRDPAWRLRGMATDPARQGHGIGGRVLRHAIGCVSLRGGGLLWCQARVPARRFYERAGFAAVGDEWVELDLGPHVAMWRDVVPPLD
jgi:GNAT superfamily N-acetyltransferase